MNRSHGDFTPSKPNPFADPKVRLRHHSLMQDYRELHMETEAVRKKLQTIRERKATLMAEVRFLRRRYRHLTQDQHVMQQPDMKKVRRRSNGGKKRKVNDETKTSLKRKVPLFDLNKISGEEEGEREAVNSDQERMRVEEGSSCKKMSSIEMKLSSCRNGGDGSNKRKISWQDPVAALLEG